MLFVTLGVLLIVSSSLLVLVFFMLGGCRLLGMNLAFSNRFFMFGLALSSGSDRLIIGDLFGFHGLCVETNVKMSSVFSFSVDILDNSCGICLAFLCQFQFYS